MINIDNADTYQMSDPIEAVVEDWPGDDELDSVGYWRSEPQVIQHGHVVGELLWSSKHGITKAIDHWKATEAAKAWSQCTAKTS